MQKTKKELEQDLKISNEALKIAEEKRDEVLKALYSPIKEVSEKLRKLFDEDLTYESLQAITSILDFKKAGYDTNKCSLWITDISYFDFDSDMNVWLGGTNGTVSSNFKDAVIYDDFWIIEGNVGFSVNKGLESIQLRAKIKDKYYEIDYFKMIEEQKEK